MDDDLHDARNHDRMIRAQIDPLISQLSVVGRLELAARLLIEAATPSRRYDVNPRQLPPVRRELQGIERDGDAAEVDKADVAAPIYTTNTEDETHGN